MMNKKRNASRIRIERTRAKRRKAAMILVSICLVITGFIIADASIVRHSLREPAQVSAPVNAAQEAALPASFVSEYTPSIALDNSVMLSSVIKEAKRGGFTSITFDLKRSDGTVGYASQLVTVNTLAAVSAPASKLHESMKALKKSNIECIGRLCCLRDNLAPRKSSAMAVMNGPQLYTDGDGNTYLNPDSAEAYAYLLEIVNESKNLGVNVMILSHCRLPKEIRSGHNDGFDKLSQRLYADTGGGITFLEGVDAQIKGWNAEDGEYNLQGIRNDIKKLPKLKEHQIYVISTRRDKGDVNAALKKAGIKRYVITDD